MIIFGNLERNKFSLLFLAKSRTFGTNFEERNLYHQNYIIKLLQNFRIRREREIKWKVENLLQQNTNLKLQIQRK